jgi:hypothetical protein
MAVDPMFLLGESSSSIGGPGRLSVKGRHDEAAFACS